MRKTINPQPNLREPWLELEHARELETISSLLDAHPKLNELVLQDLKSVTPSAGSDVGRGGMSAEQVLRALLVKQLNQFSYRELAFHLADSRSTIAGGKVVYELLGVEDGVSRIHHAR